MQRQFLFPALFLFLWAGPLHAKLKIVCTTSSLGALTRAIVGTNADVTVLAPPDRDVHNLVARPSMMADLRRADLMVVVGASLEEAWLQPLLEGAGNPKIQIGKPGFFEASEFLTLIDRGEANRALGDVHPQGNPHFHLDPIRMGELSKTLGKRLSQLDSSSKFLYAKNAANFQKQLNTLAQKIKKLPRRNKGVLFYHKDGDYLARFMRIPVWGYVERLPGVPPSPGHLRSLLLRNRSKKGVIISSSHHPKKGGDYLAGQLKWPHRVLPLEPEENSAGKEFLDHLFRWAKTIAGY